MVWRTKAAHGDERVIGQGRMISLWPVRAGVLVDGGVAYFGAGVFPSESIYICAVNADDGTIIWRNDQVGERGPEQQYDGISPQGYLLATSSTLYIPSGRSMPAAFDRETGKFLFYLSPGGKVGGTYALITGEHLVSGVNEQRVYESKAGKRVEGSYAWSPAHRLIVAGDISYSLGDHHLSALDRSRYAKVAEERRGVAGKRQKLQSGLRTVYRARSRLNRNDPDYNRNYAALTEQYNKALEQISQLTTEQEDIEGRAFKWQRENNLRDSMILAGDKLFVGGTDQVIAIDAETGKWVWTGNVEGRASSLAVADGRLYVSSNTGKIHCFAGGSPAFLRSEITPAVRRSPYPADKLTELYKRAAELIVAETGIRKGFCLVLGCGEGRLALELARRTDLEIYGLDPDPQDVAKARKAIDRAGLYGSRITIDLGSLQDLPYPPYFANLIVSDDLLIRGRLDASVQEMHRVLKPVGGMIYFGQPVEAKGLVRSIDIDSLSSWMRGAESPAPKISRSGGLWASITRGPLPGAGAWTHQYADPSNSTNSGDQLITGSLGVLWFGRPGPERMVERHARAAAPLSLDGRLFVQGENVLMAYDAYNGVELWKRDIPGAVRVRVDVDGSNMAVTKNGLFVGTRDKALRLDPASGETLNVYPVPKARDGNPRRWGYLASIDKTLFGSSAQPLAQEYGAGWQNVSEDPIDNLNAYRRFNSGGGMWRGMQNYPSRGREDTWKGALGGRMIASDSFFALDIETGQPRWIYQGKIAHGSISMGEDAVFLADAANISQQEKVAAVAARRERYGKLSYEDDSITDYSQYDVRRLVKLDIRTGEKLWERIVDITGSGGDKLGLAYHDGMLMIFGHFSNHDGGTFSKGGLAWRRVTVLSSQDGYDMWSKELNYLRRPLVMGDQLIVEPRSVNLRTGEYQTRIHPVTGETVPWEFKRGGHSCGITTASADTFFLRSYSMTFYDVKRDSGMIPFGGIRSGCWISMISANGLAMMPEASAGCTCSFPIRSTVVMAPKNKQRKWTVYVQSGPMTPVKEWYLNLGAPGDRKDNSAKVWFGYPRLRLGYGVRFDLSEQIQQGLGYYARSEEGEAIGNTDTPWVFTSGVAGLAQYKLPLLGEGQAPATYTVRLGFCEPIHNRAGARVFDVKLNGRIVLRDFDIAQEAGGKNIALLKEFRGVEVSDDLTVELVSRMDQPSEAQAPLLNSVEVVR